MLSTIYLFIASLFVQQPTIEAETNKPEMRLMDGGGGVIVPERKKEN